MIIDILNKILKRIKLLRFEIFLFLIYFSHRNGAVRKVASQSLLAVVEKMGATRILTSAKDVTERLLPTTAQFLMDGTPLTRYITFLNHANNYH